MTQHSASADRLQGLLRLALRLAFGAQRQQRWRRLALFTAGAVGASLIVLSFAVASVIQSVNERESNRTGVLGPPGEASLLLVNRADAVGDRQFPVIYIAPGPRAPVTEVLPPGVAQMPQPGQVVISPRLAELARADPLLARRYPPSSAVIAQSALAYPDELLAYVRPRAGREFSESDPVFHVTRFGGAAHDGGTVSVGARFALPTLQMLLGAAALLGAPVILLVCAAAATASPTRDHRLQVLRWLGMSTGQALFIVVVETVIGFGTGAVVAGAIWLVSLAFLDEVPVLGIPVTPGDLTVGVGEALAAAAIAVCVGVLGAIATDRWRTMTSGPRPGGEAAAGENLSTCRYLPAATGLLLVMAAFAIRGRAGGTVAMAGVVTMILSIPLLAARWIATIGKALRQRTATSMVLAGRRLERQPMESARPLMGVAALSLVLGAAAGFLAVVRAPDPVERTSSTIATYGISFLNPRAEDIPALRQLLPAVVIISYQRDSRTNGVVIHTDCARFSDVLGVVGCEAGKDITLPTAPADHLRRLLRLPGTGQVRISGAWDPAARAILVIAPADVPESLVRASANDAFLAPAVSTSNLMRQRESPLVAWVLAALLAAGLLAGLGAMILTVDGVLRSARRHAVLRALGLTSAQMARLEALQFGAAYITVVGSSYTIGVALCAAVTVIGGSVPMPWPLLARIALGLVAVGAVATLLILGFAGKEQLANAESIEARRTA